MNISVVIPTYNEEKYIRKCLLSIISNDLKVNEIIVVDDQSIDKTQNEVEKVKKITDIPIKVIKTSKNSGPAKARNLGAY